MTPPKEPGQSGHELRREKGSMEILCRRNSDFEKPRNHEGLIALRDLKRVYELKNN